MTAKTKRFVARAPVTWTKKNKTVPGGVECSKWIDIGEAREFPDGSVRVRVWSLPLPGYKWDGEIVLFPREDKRSADNLTPGEQAIEDAESDEWKDR